MPESSIDQHKSHRFPRGYSEEDIQLRKSFFENHNSIKFTSNENFPPESFKGIIENQIGFMNTLMNMKR